MVVRVGPLLVYLSNKISYECIGARLVEKAVPPRANLVRTLYLQSAYILDRGSGDGAKKIKVRSLVRFYPDQDRIGAARSWL